MKPGLSIPHSGHFAEANAVRCAPKGLDVDEYEGIGWVR